MQYLPAGGKRVLPLGARQETPAISLVRGFLGQAGSRAWLTGGTVRDLLLNRRPDDVDLVIDGDPESPARGFADDIGGSYFSLSEEFQTCRVISADRTAVYDFAACRGGSIEADLRHRDFKIDAMAIALSGGGEAIDPLGGLEDLRQRRISAVAADIFERDPLRLIRAVRLEKKTGFAIAPELADLIRANAVHATRPAVERIFSEITRLLEAPGAAAAIRRLDELDLLEVLFPEICALKGVTQNDYHHLDVYEHTLANNEALDRIIEDPAAFFPGQAETLKERRERRLAGDASWRFVMSFSSLMHDVAKPYCRFTDTDGQVRFFEHARLGADMVTEILRRLKASADVIRAVSFLVGKHMRFEGLLQEKEPSQRARLRYLRATEPLSPEAIVLSVSDRLSVCGILVSEADVENHLALARQMMAAAIAAEEAEPVQRLIDGDDLMRELGLGPGPLVGKILNLIEEEQRLGHAGSRRDALAIANHFLREEASGGPKP